MQMNPSFNLILDFTLVHCCVALGDTLEETKALMREVARLHIEELQRKGAIIPHSVTLADKIEIDPRKSA